MKYITVKFKGTEKRYIYKTRLNLMVGAIYDITADNSKTYNNPVLIEGINEKAPKNYSYAYPMREITIAVLIQSPRRPTANVKIIINEKKKTTVAIWGDGSKTVVKCQPGDEFDAEKGIAMCFVKRSFNNRGCYNDWMREVISANER
mgnify:FL=1